MARQKQSGTASGNLSPMLVIPPPSDGVIQGPSLTIDVESFMRPEPGVVSDIPKNEPPPLFTSANLGPGINPDMARIVETIYQVDAFSDYRDLEQNLEVGEERGQYKTLAEHLDKGEKRARRAHALYLGAKLELAKWEIDSRKVTSVMRGEAHAELEAEKAAGERKKMITNDDIETRISEKYPDEWASQELSRVKLKGTVEHLERLAELWKNRCFSLGTQLSNLRK
jgi:hypothetical protein